MRRSGERCACAALLAACGVPAPMGSPAGASEQPIGAGELRLARDEGCAQLGPAPASGPVLQRAVWLVELNSADAVKLVVLDVVNIWAPLCAPCRQEMPAFQAVSAVSDEFAGRAFFMGLDIGSYMPGLGNQDQARQFLAAIGVHYPNAFPVESPLRACSIRSVPTTLYLSPDGKLVHQDNGPLTEDGLRENVQTLVALYAAIPGHGAPSAAFISPGVPLPGAAFRRRGL